jgi:hypothetical protein
MIPMASKPVMIASRSFASQKEATEFFRAMLRSYTPGSRVNDVDALHLAALLERHSEYVQKVGCGLDHFSVVMTEHGTPCFNLIRRDGTGTEFSYLHCITQRPPSRKQEVSSAFRWLVRLDLFKKRDEFFAEFADAEGRVPCAETGERIIKSEAHMDHRAPMTFEVIVLTFLAGRGMAYADVPITEGQDNQTTAEITDLALGEEFRRYHAKVALLDLVRNKVNLAQSGRNRMKPTRIQL